jgi:tripartite-type tricarboxylate transporter receptor subunit TctC
MLVNPRATGARDNSKDRRLTMPRRALKALAVASLAIAVFAAAWSTSGAQDRYPSRTVRLIVAFAPGGVADIMGRLVAQLLQHKLGGTIIVENKPGGDGLIGMGEAVRAAPDGYTFLVGGFGGQIVPPLMKDDFPFDVRRDIVKIAMTAEFANVLVVNKDLPVNSVAELIAYLKKHPGKFNFGSSGRATSDRLAAEMFMLETGTKMQNVPYRGGGVALNDMMAGTTQVMFPQLPAVIGMATSGAVKPLAVTSNYRLSQLPDVPTLAEAVLPGYHVTSWNMLFAPRGLPEHIRKLLSDALVEAVKDPQFRERMHKIGVEPAGKPSAEADAFFEAELVRWKKVIDTSGLKLER